MATECHTQFGFSFQRKLCVDFAGGTITSDGGLLLLRELDERLGLTCGLDAAVRDPRDGRYVTHELRTLLRQRVYQIAAGYEDANDASTLRYDPTMQVVAHRPGVELASQPTLSRLENEIEWGSIARLTRLGVEWFEAHVAPPPEVILDVDSTDDPTHGAQQLSFFNGHYDEHMYHPLLVFEGTSGVLLGSRLRAGNEGGATRLLPLLRSIVGRLHVGRPGRRLALRADGGFCNPEVLAYAEAAHLHYAIGLPRNSVLEAHVARACEQAQKWFARHRQPVRRFHAFWYRAESWPAARRVCAKIEVTARGLNVRFVVTNRTGKPAVIFAWYNARGQAENFIKELKRDVAADRLSCHAFRANALRLQLHTLAYNLLVLFRRRALATTVLATATLGTIRLRLFKVGARVRHTARRLWIHLATGWPGQTLYRTVWGILAKLKPRRTAPA
jgi:hypothetical protein